MPTGDGLLARLTLTDALTQAQLAGLAAAAARHGNGLLEVTRRGSLQARGLAPATAAPFAAEIASLALPLDAAPTVTTGPLAGLDPTETADPRPLAATLRTVAARFAPSLHPKVAIVVDGGGALPLDTLAADIRLVAGPGGWRLDAGGRTLGHYDGPAAVAAATALLDRLAATAGRARDLPLSDEPPPPPRHAEPVGRFLLADGTLACGLALPFGLADAATLAALAEAAGTAPIRPAPGGALIALGLTPSACAAFTAAAARLGLVTDPDDPRRAITACAGAPACAAGHLATRPLAARLAGRLPAGTRLHLSGCAKACGQPAGAITVTGTADGPRIDAHGLPIPAALADLLATPEPAR
jgi:precorrin-3B synthase